MLTPVAKRVIIKPVEAKQGTLLIMNQKPSQYIVISTGDEVTKVAPGNIIYMENRYGLEIEHQGEKFLVIDESAILAKLTTT